MLSSETGKYSILMFICIYEFTEGWEEKKKLYEIANWDMDPFFKAHTY